MPKAKTASALLDELRGLYPNADCELVWKASDPFQLLCATILSAQCTDERVNRVTPELFRRWPHAASLALADASELEAVIRPTGFYHNKAKNLMGMARALSERHGGRVPKTMEELIQLPGVARKTANVVLGTAFGIASGVVVDTHVRRLSGRLGLTRHEDPEKIERDLMAKVPEDRWIAFGHQLIWHGRRICHARAPECGRCSLPCPSRRLG